MQEWGNEISYHHDVMDSNQGNLDNAMEEFERNKQKFEEAGFIVETVCQHGNPIVNRKGYTSNRDFFRSDKVQKTYFNISDIMVNYSTVKDVSYTYYSDAGRKFKMIYDPFTNDLTYSEDRNISYNNLREVLTVLNDNACNIISTHPHRWTGSHFVYICQLLIFKIVKFAAKCLVKIPFCKKFIERHYDMAKKF